MLPPLNARAGLGRTLVWILSVERWGLLLVAGCVWWVVRDTMPRSPEPHPAGVLAVVPHTARVCAVAFSPDGRLLASADIDGSVRLVDRATGRGRAFAHSDFRSAPSLAFSPNGHYLAIMESGSGIGIWDVEADTEAARLVMDGTRAVGFSPNGKSVAATNGRDNTVVIWQWQTSQPPRALHGHGARPIAVAFSPDGQRLASADSQGGLLLWELATGKQRAYLCSGPTPVIALGFSPDGRTLASAGYQNACAWLWDARNGQSRGRIATSAGSILALSFTPDGRTLALAGSDGIVHFCDPTTNTERASMRVTTDLPGGMAISPEGSALATGGTDRAVHVWDLAEALPAVSL